MNSVAKWDWPYDAVVSVPGKLEGIVALGIRVEGNALLGIEFLDPKTHPVPTYKTGYKQTSTTPSAGCAKNCAKGYASEVVEQLGRYFSDPNWRFTLKIKINGSAFQHRVWAQLKKITSNNICTYGELAKTLSSSPRAIGGACKANPVPIIVPCHRVVAANGLGGFCGSREEHSRELKIKQWLLEHEKCGW